MKLLSLLSNIYPGIGFQAMVEVLLLTQFRNFTFSMKNRFKSFIGIAAMAIVLGNASCRTKVSQDDLTIKSVMDGVVTRFYEELTPAQMDTLTEDYVLSYLSEEERKVLATKYWTFEVNVPVTVSVMRHVDQKVVPFWLSEGDFRKTDLIVKNENYTYEVWQKDFVAGKVELGINGFDKHRPVYFISVGPKDQSQELKITDVFPAGQHFEITKPGAFTYHDWDGLILTEVPDALLGQTLFTTIRGRAREAHVIKAFRDTPHPSSEKPDQILLTWSDDVKTSMDIQWRTNPTVRAGQVKYWADGLSDTLTTDAKYFLMEDRLLRNDRYIHRHTAQLRNLIPGQLYHYQVGGENGQWSEGATFATGFQEKEKFSFIWFGDTHYSPVFGQMAQKTLGKHPDIAFYQIAGDLVSTGLNRDDWDKLFYNTGDIFRYKPLMPIPGNHDSQDGLGAWMYQEMFSLPKNGPADVPSEMTYAYHYQNALFLMIDGTQSLDAQVDWIEQQLKNSEAKWKFVMFHFPPYNFGEDYWEIRQKWCSIFDKYHVDMVMSGHMHYYLRTKPMFNEKPVATPAKGTIYTMSISIEGKQEEWPDEDYAVVRYKGGPLYQYIKIDGNKLEYKCLDPEGNIKDALEIVK